MTECTWCGKELRYPDDPDTDDDGDPICERCWREEYCFHCPVCENRKWEGEDEERKQYIIVTNKDEPEPGLYRVLDTPFYTSNYFNIWYDEDKLKKVGELTTEIDFSERLVGGWVCLDCVKNIHKHDRLGMMKHGNCLWCGRAGVTLMDGRFCGLCQGDLPEPLKPRQKG